ncbi:fasciclin domain-containing protein [Aerosakkonemataceae cyanobacterium BLCC-F154]|uniref:Fasciclin domain-containing protein n=1 Tax=Floridaenema fluviatile BLCC-F154 TaxID=3153640 RepID=A0ABV4YH43_9CYAN
MKTNYLTQLTRKLAVVTGIVGVSAFVSVPAMAQVNTNEMEMNDRTNTSPGMSVDRNATPYVQPGAAPTNLLEMAATRNSFDTLVQAAREAGLANDLAYQGPYTILAPTDRAFAALPQGAVELLLQPENRDLLRQVLSYHIIRGRVSANEFNTGPVETLGGGIAVRVTPNNRIVVNDGSVILPNIEASNGIIHGINTVLLPQSLQDTIASRLANR